MKVYRKEPDENGPYQQADGRRFTLYACRRHSGPEGINIGWTEFPNLDAALEAWELRLLPTETEAAASAESE